jgi:hypothetical protein
MPDRPFEKIRQPFNARYTLPGEPVHDPDPSARRSTAYPEHEWTVVFSILRVIDVLPGLPPKVMALTPLTAYSTRQ